MLQLARADFRRIGGSMKLSIAILIALAAASHASAQSQSAEPPAPGRQPNPAAKIGGGAKEVAVGAGRAVGGAARKTGEGARWSLEKAWDAGAAAGSKSKTAVQGAGRATARGVKGAGQRGSRALFNRNDAEVHDDIRDLLDANPATRGWRFDVQAGLVTLKVPRGHRADLGAVVSDLRKIVGVKSVFVIAL
jgi:hypothetical protein